MERPLRASQARCPLPLVIASRASSSRGERVPYCPAGLECRLGRPERVARPETVWIGSPVACRAADALEGAQDVGIPARRESGARSIGRPSGAAYRTLCVSERSQQILARLSCDPRAAQRRRPRRVRRSRGWIFENSPWVAERVWPLRPFTSLDALLTAMSAQVAAADDTCSSHSCGPIPISGARARMSDASTGEQSGAGLDCLTPRRLRAAAQLERRLPRAFGFPFLFAVKGSTSHDDPRGAGATTAAPSSTTSSKRRCARSLGSRIPDCRTPSVRSAALAGAAEWNNSPAAGSAATTARATSPPIG